MTTKVFDTFTGTSGDDIDTHTPDTDVVGGGWTDSGANNVELDGSGAIQFSAAQDDARIDAGTADQWVTLNFNAGGADNRFSTHLRRDDAALASSTRYSLNFRTGDSIVSMFVYRVSSGSATEIESSGDLGVSNSTTYTLDSSIEGSNIFFGVQGLGAIQVTDTVITTGDFVGFNHELYTDGAFRIYDITVDDAYTLKGTTVEDTFTGTNGTDLSDHTPTTTELFGNWRSSPSNGCELDGSGAVKWATSNDEMWIAVGHEDQWCTANFSPGSADNRCTVVLRRDDELYGAATHYEYNFRTDDATNSLQINKRVAGSNTTLASSGDEGFDNTATFSLEPIANGSTIDFQVDGSSLLSTTDSSITVGKFAGWIGFLRTNANGRLNDFKIVDTEPAAGGLGIPIAAYHHNHNIGSNL